ncbi:MAG: CocE/NonD family hydrolase [Acidimicrobiales bacterium]
MADPLVMPHVWITLADGARLGARIWLPDGGHGPPAPAILEYVPYRKDDGTFARDATLHPLLAENGYACVRVDMRGSGSSDGVLMDEYSEQEMADGEAVIDWIASQSWCSGPVGMIGISWGGISGLQMAARNPGALEAVVALGSTDSRYYDDGGYYMGCMVGQTIGWAAIMLGYNTRPPFPDHYGEGWRDLWLERLAEAPMLLGTWLDHQREDDYWFRGTVACDYDAISTPVFAVSGHADCWPNTVSRLLTNLSGPRQGLQGAWSHRYPQMAIPGPAIDFLPEVVNWFDQWLKGIDGLLDDTPLYRVFLQDSVAPQTFYEERPGRWLAFEEWPSPDIHVVGWRLGTDLALPEGTTNEVVVSSPQHVGLDGGEYMPWFNFGPGPELPADQHQEDSNSACFDSTPLDADLRIVGNPNVRLIVAADAPQALLAARLCDVAPDGSSTFITRGIANLSHRNGRTEPQPMVPGRAEPVSVELDHVGYTVPAGHQLRLALSTSYWPMAWPAPSATTLTITPQASWLDVPLLSDHDRGDDVRFDPAPTLPESPTDAIRPHGETRSRRTDPATGEHQLEIRTDNGHTRIVESGLEVDSDSSQLYRIHPDDPISARARYHWRWRYRKNDWDVETTATTEMWCSATSFEVEAEITATESGIEVFRRGWRETFPRDHF